MFNFDLKKMIFNETSLKGSFIIDIERHEDQRGFFSRSWCQQEFKIHGLSPQITQCNISFNEKQGTLRGMHYQIAPFEEAKLVRCTMGAIFDVIIDLRRESSTFKNWISIELNAENRRSLYVPEGFAHGFQTLVDNTEVLYLMSEFYHPECAKGLSWDDTTFKITWPVKTIILSEKDKNYPKWDCK